MSSKKILYVDSQVDYGQKYLSYLIDRNYNVRYITSMNDALIEYSFQKPDILITDVKLSDGSGLELIKKIKKTNKEIITFVLASEINPEVLLELIPLKIDNFLLKNVTFKELENEIKKLISIENSDKVSDTKSYDLGNDFIYKLQPYISIYDRNIPLTSQENDLIKELVLSNGESVSYEILQNCMGKDLEATIDTLRTVVRKIRKKTYSGIIQNQSGIGYKINYCCDMKMYEKFMLKIDKPLNLKVLLLKGNSAKNELLAYKLRKYLLNCDCANTINQAKELLRSESYDYIISDLNLPDGEVVDFIREFDELISTKMIILSEDKDIYYKDYLYFKGILDYVVDTSDIFYLSNTIYKTILKVESNTRFNNILVIEQSKRICEQIKDLLLPRNYNVDILNDFSQAFELLKIKKYSLIILDISYSNSFNFLDEVKNEIDKNLPFIMLSDTHRTYATVRESYKNGASECLRKPLFAEEFILKVDQFVEHSKLINEMIEQKGIMDDYKTVVDQSSIVSKTDTKGIITYANDMFCKISGYSKEELIGQPHNIVRHPDVPKSTFRQMWKTIKKDKKIWTGVVKNKRKNGEEYIVQASILPLKDAEGEVVEYIALRNDITLLKK